VDPLKPTSTVEPSPAPAPTGTVTPVFPLLLLETMRDLDRPTEVLEDEDLAISMPRRLGLSDVVGVQIRRFTEEVRQRRQQAVSQVEDLVRLVIRRPDAEVIFTEAGRRLARRLWGERNGMMRSVIRVMPRPIASVAAHRAAKRMFRTISGGAKLSISRWPFELRIRGSLTARSDPSGAACAFYAGALSELLETYTGREYRIGHRACEARGGSECAWTVEFAS
jgi:predicted hydrocarbon binding protein